MISDWENLAASHRVARMSWANLLMTGQLEIGEGSFIDEDVWLCHPHRDGIVGKTIIGKNCTIRAGSVIYANVQIGDNCNFGQHAVVREGCKIGNYSSIGTGVKMECWTNVGNHVSIETQSHITGWMEIEDYVFVGGFVGSTNDFYMNWQRERHGQGLQGPTLKYGCRIGSGAILLPKITVGRYSVVNAGEVVRKDVPDNCLMFTKKGSVIYKPIKSEILGNEERPAI